MTHNEKVAIKRLSDIKRYAVYLSVEDRYALDIAIKKLEQDAIPMSVVEDIKEEIKNLDYLVNDAKYSDAETRVHNVDYLMYEIYKILDRHMQKATGK